MNTNWLLLIYCLGVVGSSLFGGAAPTLFRLTHVRMQCLLSLVGGFVLGVALLHMIPHGASACGSLDMVIRWTLLGLLCTFFLIRIFQFHQHGPEAQPTDEGHDCSHPEHHHQHAGKSNVRWTGVLLGLSLHTLMDGVALGAAVVTDSQLHADFELPWPYGFGVFLAVFLHKPLDALSITALMTNGTWSERKRHLVNLGFALMCPLGTLLFVGFAQATPTAHLGSIMGMALGFSAGAFLCISLSDLLPEVQFHHHDRGKLSASLLLGVALAYGIGFLEDEHGHSHDGRSRHGGQVISANDDDHDQTGHEAHDHEKPDESSRSHAGMKN